MADHQTTIDEEITVNGYLDIKRDIYQMILVWYVNKKRERKSISTGLKVKGNKGRAKEMLKKACEIKQDELNPKLVESNELKKDDLLLADYFPHWLRSVKNNLEITTYGNQESCINSIMIPYFNEHGLTVQNTTKDDILDFYDFKLKTVKASTVHKYHSILNGTFNLAVEENLIQDSPMAKVKRPKVTKFIPQFLNEEQAIDLYDKIQNQKKLAIAVMLTTFYGLRRGELAGFSWPLIDFNAGTFNTGHTVVVGKKDGKKVLVKKDSAKNDPSIRTYPLLPVFKKLLIMLKEEQERNRKFFGNCYNKEDSRYVFVDSMGKLVRPDYYTQEFPKWCVKNGFLKLRLHDLRHSSASLLLATGDVSLKEIQEWLGHSSFKITADCYAHLEYKAKEKAANSMTWINKTSLGELTEAFVAKNNQPMYVNTSTDYVGGEEGI